MADKQIYLIKAGLYVSADDMPDTDGLLELLENWGRQRSNDGKSYSWVEEPKKVFLIQIPYPSNRYEGPQQHNIN